MGGLNLRTVRRAAVVLLAASALTGALAVQASAETPSVQFDFKKLEGRRILNQTPVGTSGQWTLEKLLSLTPVEQLELWRQLPPPNLDEMNGHYMGLGPIPDNEAAQKGYAAYMYDEKSVRGAWQGKAFHSLSATEGEGYNRWRFPGGRIERNLRMKTRIAPSIIDGKPAYVLDYPAYNKTTLFDELRKLEPGVYIGAATTALAGGPNGNGTRSRIDTFILIGPTDEWVGAPYGPHPTANAAH